MATIAVITPSIGRPSLEHCISRASELLRAGDHHFVVFDGRNTPPATVDSYSSLSLPFLHTSILSSLRSVSGNAQRDLGIANALALVQPRPDYLVFCDDDDLLHPDGVSALHELTPDGKMHCFLSISGGQRVGYARSLEMGHVAGGRITVPLQADLPKWAHVNVREADFFFANACKRLLGPPIWHDIPLLELDRA